jgi:phage baseplate assembly protein W
MKQYRGFSTKHPNAINDVLTGSDVVIEDLMNEIMTRKGERLMMPTFGCVIHDMIFEPLDEDTKELIYEDLTRIFNNEPRVELLSDILIEDSEHSITATVTIKILPSNEVETLTIDVERE